MPATSTCMEQVEAGFLLLLDWSRISAPRQDWTQQSNTRLEWIWFSNQIEGVYVTTQHMSVTGSRTRSRIRPMIWHRAFNRWAVTWWYKRFSPQNSSGFHCSASLAPTTLSHAPPEQLCHTTQAEVRLVSGPRSCIHRERRHRVSLRRECIQPAAPTARY